MRIVFPEDPDFDALLASGKLDSGADVDAAMVALRNVQESMISSSAERQRSGVAKRQVRRRSDQA
jgi:hypothetical protein